MELETRFTDFLAEIASHLESEQLEKLKFLCKNFIPDGDREKISTPLQLLRELEKRRKIGPNNLEFLADCLKTVGREDLAERVKNFESVCPGSWKGGRDPNSTTSNEPRTSPKSSAQDAERYANRGRVELQNDNYDAACRQYTLALERLPEEGEEEARVKYLYSRAACYLRMKNFKDAHNDCDAALFLRPENNQARYGLVQSLEGEENISGAYIEVTSLLRCNPQNSKIVKLERKLKKKVEEAEAKANEKRIQGDGLFAQEQYQDAIMSYTEGIMLLPDLVMYEEEMSRLYLCRARSYLKEMHLMKAEKDCEKANRLAPQDLGVLHTWMQVLEKLKKYQQCFRIANQLVQGEYKAEDARDTKRRILPQIAVEEEEVGLQQGMEDSRSRGLSKKTERAKEKEKETFKGDTVGIFSGGGPLEGKRGSQSLDSFPALSSDTSPSLPLSQSFKGEDASQADAAGVMPPRTLPASVNDLVLLGDSLQSSTTKELKSSIVLGNRKTVTEMSELQSLRTESVRDVADASMGIKRKVTAEDRYTSGPSDKLVNKAEDKRPIGKPLTGLWKGAGNGTNLQLSLGESYPRRILTICDQWSCWHRSVCTVNRQLCRSLAKFKDVDVACLVLEATDQDKMTAARDGVNLIKAATRPGLRGEQLLFTHGNIPFKVDLVVGNGMVTGPAAFSQAQILSCSRLHIFHNLPNENETLEIGLRSQHNERAEMELGLSADFVAAVGPLLADEWSMALNREVFVIIPGMSDISPRNSIPSPQCRCLILGDMSGSKIRDLDLAINALVNCRKRRQHVRLILQGIERDKVSQLKEDLRERCRSSRVVVDVKPFEVSREVIGIEIRGVSVVLMPSGKGFGFEALEAISAGVPAIISASSGFASVIQKEFDEQFLDLLCTTKNDEDCVSAWTSAIDNILDDSESAFKLAETLRERWSSKFTWDLTANKLLKHLASSGKFSKLSPLTNVNIALPSKCSDAALNFILKEVDLLNRRRKHVLFLSPEDCSKVPLIKCFAHVPWIAVLDFDVNSVKTGYLASCEEFCENMGMKICRLLPQPIDEERKRYSTMLPNGIPWVLLEGTPECKRNITENLEWIREFFLALAKTHPLPITFIILWRSLEETTILCKKLSKILTIVQGSPLQRQVTLVIASTGASAESHLLDIAEDWGVTVKIIDLEDICNALYQCVTSSPFVQENEEYVLPVAAPDEPQRVSFKVLPPSSRWINAEVEVLYQSVGGTPKFESDDAYHFYRGGQISWYAIQMGYSVDRGNVEALKLRIDELLIRAGTMRLKMPHQRGAGGTTTARKILYDYHEKYPCVFLSSVSHAEVAPAIKILAAFCRLPVIILIDCKQVQSDEFDVDMLYDSLSTDRTPSVILEVIHLNQQRERNSSPNSEKTAPVRLADALDQNEAAEFVEVYGTQRREKLGALRSLLRCRQRELQIPFYYALITFEDRFTALEPFVKECLENLHFTERQVLLFLALAYHYGHSSISANDFTGLLEAPRYEVLSLESVLPALPRELLLEEDGKWRPRHDLIAVEMLRHLLTLSDEDGSPLMHPDNWKNQLAVKAMDLFKHMSEIVVSNMLLSRFTGDNFHQNFSQLISDIPFDEDAIQLFERAIALFPDNPFFRVHLGRYYSIQKKSAGLELAIKYTNEGIALSDDFSSRVVRGQFAQMKGVVYSREVYNLAESNTVLEKIIDMADEGVKNFRRAVSIAPDLVDGYIPEVRMMCKVFEYIDRTTGSFCNYIKSPKAHPFIIDAISNTSNTLECVPDSDEYAYWRMRLACLGRRSFSTEKMQETMNLLLHLRNSNRASRGSINRQIVVMRMQMQSLKKRPLSDIAREMIDLLEEALRFDSRPEQTMRLWVRLAPFIPVGLAESESRIFQWCLKEKSVRSYLYKYILAFLQLLERGHRSYSEIMKNAKEDLNSAIKAINRVDVGRCRHPDRPVVWLGQQSKGMGNLVYFDEKILEVVDPRMKRFIPTEYSRQLRLLTGRIAETGPKVGTIRVNGKLDVSFRADLCETRLVSSAFTNRKVQFFLAFTFFGVDAYNVEIVPE